MADRAAQAATNLVEYTVSELAFALKQTVEDAVDTGERRRLGRNVARRVTTTTVASSKLGRARVCVIGLILLTKSTKLGRTSSSVSAGRRGYSSRQSNVLILLAALEQLLAEQGHSFEHGASIAAANEVYLK